MSENLIHPVEPSDAWTQPQTLFQSADIRRPTIAVSGDNEVHVLWENNNIIFHTCRRESVWQTPRRLIGGQQPYLSMDATGRMNLVFRNGYSGRDEIYHTIWQGKYWALPLNVSYTSGTSRNPVLVIAPDGRRHVVWEDETPGYAALYHAQHLSGWQWESAPIPNTAGHRPAATFDVEGGLHLLYQSGNDRIEASDIYYLVFQEGEWSPPQRISSGEYPAGRPRLVIDLNGVCHAVWREQHETDKFVMYARKDEEGWHLSQPISPPLFHTGSPALTIASRLYLHSAWNDKQRFEQAQYNVQQHDWDPLELALTDGLRLSAPVMTTDNQDRVHAVWVRQVDETMWELRYAVRQPALQETIYLPLV